MRLAAKLVLLFLVGLMLIVAVFSYLTVRQEQRLAIAEHQRYASDLAATMMPSIEEAMRGGDHAAMQEIVTRSTRQVRHVRVRFVDLNASTDGTRMPSVPLDLIVAKREVTTISLPSTSGRDVLYTYVPIADADRGDGAQAGSIEISAPDVASDERLRHSLWSSLVALVTVATLSGIVILLGGIVMVGKPLNQLIDKVQRAGRGDFSHPLRLQSKDELGRLGLALNQMCDQLSHQRAQLETETSSRIATLEQLRHSDRLNTVGRMAAGIAHEIGTPLNVVSGRAELIASGQLSDEETHQSALAIRSEAQRITKTIRELLDFARQTTPHPTRRSLAEIIEVTVNLMGPLAGKHGVEITLDLPEDPAEADLDPAQIQQVLTNLIVNAIQSTRGDGRVMVTLSNVLASSPHDSEQGERLCRRISIRDNGGGIAEADLQHLFEPFFTTKDVGEGTGLGLSISHGIIQEHGGWIEVESELNVGSCFSVYLPAPEECEQSGDE